MTVYLITLLITVLFSRIAERRFDSDEVINDKYEEYKGNSTDIYYLISAGALIFVSGFRYRVGTDYWHYYHDYKFYINRLLHSIVTLDEPGFGLLSWIVTRLVNDGAVVIFASALVTIALPMSVFYKHTEKYALTTALFILMGFWHGSFNGVRQYLAAAVLFCGYMSLKEGDFRKYCTIVLAAFLFHRSAIVMLFLFFICHRKITRLRIFLTAAFLGLSSFLSQYSFLAAGWIMDKQYSLSNGYTSHRVNAIRIAAACIPAVIFLVLYWGEELSKTETFYLNILIIHAAIRLFTMNSALLYRISIYTTAFAILAIAGLLDGLTDSNKKVITAGLIAMHLGMWWYELSSTATLNHFQWIWQR